MEICSCRKWSIAENSIAATPPSSPIVSTKLTTGESKGWVQIGQSMWGELELCGYQKIFLRNTRWFTWGEKGWNSLSWREICPTSISPGIRHHTLYRLCIPMKPEATPGKSAIMCAAKLSVVYMRVACVIVHMCTCICVCACVGVISKFSAIVCAHHSRMPVHTSRGYTCHRQKKRDRRRMGVRVCDNIVQVVRKPYRHFVRYSVFHLSSRKISRHGEKLQRQLSFPWQRTCTASPIGNTRTTGVALSSRAGNSLPIRSSNVRI